MKCPRCQQENPTLAHFCMKCGTGFNLMCAKCNAELPPDAAFCFACGQPASAAPGRPRGTSPDVYTPRHLADKIRTSKSALEGERKQVTVLFADLKGSMELLADRDPEEARHLLDPILERMMEAVHEYEGTVNQVMGDGIMALFGAPVAHEDHAVRACYAALRIQEFAMRYDEEVRRAYDIAILVRVGLNSGEVVVRSIGSDLHMDYTAVGQTTHLAARMEQIARPGSIVITANCWRAVEGYVQAKCLGPVPIKGLSAPVAVYELIGAGPARTSLQARAARGLTRFTGRAVELLRLSAALELAAVGRGQIVAIFGEPGVGKSRLLRELIDFRRTGEWLVLETSALSYGRATPYLPVVDLLRTYFGVESRDNHREILDKVIAKLFALDRTLEPTLPALLALLDVPVEDAGWRKLDPAQCRRFTLDAVKRLLLRESQAQPLLLVFEDLHWVDTETQALLNGLVEGVPTAAVLLVASYRPEYQHRWGNKSHYTHLRIDPLGAESAESLLDALVGEDPTLGPLKRLLIERTGGNPFFLEESVRTMIETGVVTGEANAYRLGNPQETVQVPATVQAVLAARIDRLPPEDKRLLQSAAVIGRDVPLSLLQTILDEPEDMLRGALSRLQAAEFLNQTRLFPDMQFTFKHALTQEVAYGALLYERRRAIHARVVDAIEREAAGRLTEQVDRLAHHAVRAELWEKAVAYLHQAGLKAKARSASREAASYVEQALSALAHLPETPETLGKSVDLRFDLHSALIPLGELDRILDVLREAESLAQKLGDQRRLGRLSASMATWFWLVGDPDRALERGQRALVMASALDDSALEALANHRVGEAYVVLGEYRMAIDSFGRNLEKKQNTPSGGRFGMAALQSVTSRSWLAWCLGNLGEFDTGMAIAEEGIRVAEAADHPDSLAPTYSGAGHRHLMRGDLPEAISYLERSVSICQRRDFAEMYMVAASNLGLAYALSGRVDEGLDLLERLVERSASVNMVPFQTMLFSCLSEALLLAGRRTEAMDWAQRTLSLVRGHRQRFAEPNILRVIGDIHASQDPPEIDEAERSYRQALAVASEIGMRPLAARVQLQLGTMCGKAGKQAQAQEHLASAVGMLRGMGMRLWLEQAETAMMACV